MTKGHNNRTGPAAARKDLAQFARELRQLAKREQRLQKLGRPFPPSIDPTLADYVVKSLYGFLRGKPNCPTLDHAFGLKGPGRPKGSGDMVTTIYQVADKLLEGKTITAIAKEYDRRPSEVKKWIEVTYQSEFLRYLGKRMMHPNYRGFVRSPSSRPRT
jgi:hypothetical protein